MSIGPRPEPVGEWGSLPTRWGKLLPFLALFLRLSLGLSLMNTGLAAVLSQNGPGGGMGFAGRGMNLFGGAPLASVPGLEGLAYVLPYVELAVAVGILFGIFTTISALAGCALTLVSPLLMTFALVTTPGFGGGPTRFMPGPEFLLLFPGQSALGYCLLVLLSPQPLNRFSIDALIFQRSRAPIPPEPEATPDTPLAPDPLAGWPGPPGGPTA